MPVPGRFLQGSWNWVPTMKKILLLLIAVLALIVPAGTASATDWDRLFEGAPGHLDIIVGPDAIRFSMEDIRVEGEEASKLRKVIDNSPAGDGDDVVSESEAATFQAFVTASVNAMAPQSFDLDLVKMDGRAPYAEDHPVIHVESLKIHGAEGDVESTTPISADLSVLLRFESVDQTRTTHHLRLENIWGDLTGHDLEYSPGMEIRVQGYQSWTIQEDSIRPSGVKEHYQDGVLVFTGADVERFEGQADGLEFEIQGDPAHRILTDTEESPAVAPVVVLLFALGALLGLRRRR